MADLMFGSITDNVSINYLAYINNDVLNYRLIITRYKIGNFTSNLYADYYTFMYSHIKKDCFRTNNPFMWLYL